MHPNNEPKYAGLRRVDARRLEVPAFSVLQRNCHGVLVFLAVGRTRADARYYSYVEPIQIAWRKRPRMARFAIASLDGLACGEVDLAPCSRHCIPVCAEIVEAHRVYLSKYLFCGSKVVSRHWHGVPLVIDLDLSPDSKAMWRVSSADGKRSSRRAGGASIAG
jgi:hypothetical protein